MTEKILADFLVALHLSWILFMVVGFVLTLVAFLRKEIFDWLVFRTLHLLGILYVGTYAVLRKSCPLTIWENELRAKADPEGAYPGSFIVHYLEKFVYPDIEWWMIFTATAIVTVFTLVVYILRPPERIKRLFVKRL